LLARQPFHAWFYTGEELYYVMAEARRIDGSHSTYSRALARLAKYARMSGDKQAG